jgi:hypothetical protein
MQKVLAAFLAVSWSLWFGGLVVLLLFVTKLFQASRSIAVEAAPVLLQTFAIYQLMVGAVACAVGTLLTLQTRRTAHAILTLLMLAALAGALLIRGWTFQMEEIRLAGNSTGPQFKQLHAKSSIAYTTSAGLLLISGIGFVVTSPTHRTESETLRA